MVKIVKFIYSQIYDRSLSKLAGNFNDEQIAAISEAVRKMSLVWSEIEAKVIAELNKYTFNQALGQIECYLVKDLPYTGISHPLTLKVNNDFDLMSATLIHELAHIGIWRQEKKLVAKMAERFPEIEEYRDLLHVAINFIQLKIMREIFDQQTLNKIMERELSLKGLKKSWDIVLANEEVLSKLFR